MEYQLGRYPIFQITHDDIKQIFIKPIKSVILMDNKITLCKLPASLSKLQHQHPIQKAPNTT